MPCQMPKTQKRLHTIENSGAYHRRPCLRGCCHLAQELTVPVCRTRHVLVDSLGDQLEDALHTLIEGLNDRTEGRAIDEARLLRLGL